MALQTGEMLQNRYRIVSPLGQGGMGAVYRAWDNRLEISVAIKEMTPQMGLDPQMLAQLRQQFRQEATVLARLAHPHLVRVTDFFEERGNVYLVMDFVEGQSLADLIARHGSLPEAQVLAWAGQLLDALAYCHSKGVIHRDIKPQNVIIRPNGQAVLVDFGLVKLWDPRDPRTRTVVRGMGTPEYAPPEQYDIGAGHTDPRSDLYSLGATLYHALTGYAPLTATMRIAAPDQFQPLRALAPGVSPRTEAAVMRAMELSLPARWPDARTMAQALGLSPSGWMTAAPPPPPTQTRTQRMPGAVPAAPSPPPAPVVPLSHKVGWSLWFWWVLVSTMGGSMLWGAVVPVVGSGGEAMGETAGWAMAMVVIAVFEAINGAVSGAVVGIGQWLVLRKQVRRAGWWILASLLGWALGGVMCGFVLLAMILAVDRAMFGDAGETVLNVVFGAVCSVVFGVMGGAGVGIGQWLVVRKQVRRAGWWILASILGGAMGGVVVGAVGWAVGGAVGGAVYGLLTGPVLLWLLRHPKADEGR